MRTRLMMGLLSVVGLLGMAAPAMADEYGNRDGWREPAREYRPEEYREPAREYRGEERREMERFDRRRFDRDERFEHGRRGDRDRFEHGRRMDRDRWER